MFKFSALLIFLLFSFYSFSEEEKWSVQTAHSEVLFKIKYLNSVNVTGHFSKVSGAFLIDGNDLKTGHVDVDLKSLYTGNSMRDGHLKGKDFFYVSKFPKARVELGESIQISHDPKSVNASLSFHGREVFTKIKIGSFKKRKDTWGYDSVFFDFEFEIKRSDFGLSWNKTVDGNEFLISDTVLVYGQIQLQPSAKMTPSSQHKIPDSEVIRNREKFRRGEIGQDQLIKVKASQKSMSDVPKIKELKNIDRERSEKQVQTPRPEAGLSKWLAFIAVFFFGVLGTIWLSFFIKKHVFFSSSKTKEILADVFVVALFMILSSSLFSLMP